MWTYTANWIIILGSLSYEMHMLRRIAIYTTIADIALDITQEECII